MIRALTRLPFFVVLMAISAASMLVPAIVGAALEDFDTARVFLYYAILFGVLTGFIGLVTQSARDDTTTRSQLVTLFLAYLFLPAMLAAPMDEAVGNTRFFNVYIEMVSSLTTTGGSLYAADRLADTVHLWRGLVGWMGGFLIWVTAIAVLAPLNLGGYEVTSEAQVSGIVTSSSAQIRAASPSERLARHAFRLAPVYAGLTAVLWILLIASGEAPLVAVIHAMSTLSTSGISAVGGLEARPSGLVGELFIFVFLVFAVSRRSFTSGVSGELARRLARDREVKLALFVVVVLSTLIFARHWYGALDAAAMEAPANALGVLWGSMFTILSFLTTTGFVSTNWAEAQAWAGLGTPGLLLIGLVLMGGGVATTAGGIKLLRVYALYKHGTREMGKLIYPHSVAGAGRLGRRIRREGAYIAWIFFMLLILSMAAVMALLALTGLPFERSLVLTVSALTTTGPLAAVASETPIVIMALSDPAKAILAFAMIIGRMETLVLLALFNPAFWRS